MSKPGVHVQVENRDPNYDQRIIDLKPAGLTAFCKLSSWWWVETILTKSPHTHITVRIAEGEEERKANIGKVDAFDAANKFAALAWQFIPAEKRAQFLHRIHFQPWDEWGADEKDPDLLRLTDWLDQYDLAAIDAFKALGMGYAAINYAEGNPPMPPFNVTNGWQLRIKTLRKINQVGPRYAIVNLHTYGYGRGMFDSADAHLERPFLLEKFLDDNGLKNVFIGISEDGKDSPSFASSFDFYLPEGVSEMPYGMTAFKAYTSDYILWDTILCETRHWRVLWHNWYTLDMIPDGYEVADRPQIVGNKVVDIHPIFSDYEAYVKTSPPVYLYDAAIAGGPIEVPVPTPTPQPKGDRVAKVVLSVNCRAKPDRNSTFLGEWGPGFSPTITGDVVNGYVLEKYYQVWILAQNLSGV